jgi:alginate O-acetyltransferase complex protein AlgI
MLFNSFEFLLFLPIVFILYWFVFNKNLKVQNSLILVSSYLFYGWWDYRFLTLIFFSTIVDYIIGLNIPKQNSEKNQKLLLWCSVLFNLSVLGFFKYYNFFVDSWLDLFSTLGYEIKGDWTLNIILPVGISFYTFQTMSYTIDIYRKKLNPTTDFISFASFVSFFPQLVAGPIERASNLIPQFLTKRKFSYEIGFHGLYLIIWGMFKKIVIADSLAPIVDDIFLNYENHEGGMIFLGLVYFGFQAYADFSGYSDISIGTASLFGIKLMSNFNYPFFSRNIVEFWRRWHISMTTWFTDYLFIPLKIHYRKSNSLVNFLVLLLYFNLIGLWHGANLTFMFFGIYHCLLFSPSIKFTNYFKLNSINLSENKIFPDFKELFKVCKTFLLVTIGWSFFRAETISESFLFLNKIFLNPSFPEFNRSYLFIYILPFIIFEYMNRKNINLKGNKLLKNPFILSLLILTILNHLTSSFNFLYFRF